MAGGKGGHDTVAPQGCDLQGGDQIAARHDREIDLPAVEAPQQSFACAFGVAKHDIGMSGTEFRREGRESPRQDAGLDADRDLSGLALARSLRAGVHAGHVVEDRLGPADELLTERRWYDPGGGAEKQRDIQPLLEVVQGSADGGLSGVQETRRAMDAAVLGDRPHAQQLPEVERRAFHTVLYLGTLMR